MMALGLDSAKDYFKVLATISCKDKVEDLNTLLWSKVVAGSKGGMKSLPLTLSPEFKDLAEQLLLGGCNITTTGHGEERE